jgi:hypothetical protein
MPECERCGDDLVDDRDKNSAGHWRDRCIPCMREMSPEERR